MNLLLLTLVVSMQSTDLRMQADALFNDQQWAELITVLDELIEDQPSAELYYDKGIALYEQAAFELARNAFDEAMNLAADNELRAFSAYNYGNALFQETMQGLEGTTEVSSESIQAIEDAKSHIQQSINHYRDAIQQDSSDIDARTNGEIAWHLLKQLQQMQEQMEQQREQEEDANNQEQQQEQDSSGQEQEQQDGRDNEEQDDQESEQDEQQNQSNEDGRQQDSKSEESNQQSNNQNESNDEEGDSDEQKSVQQNTNEGDAEQNEQDESQQHKGDRQEQDQPLQDGKLETADKQEEMQQGEEREGQIKREGNRLSKDETNRLLQLIRDKEKERRQAIAARKAKNRKPVTKDW